MIVGEENLRDNQSRRRRIGQRRGSIDEIASKTVERTASSVDNTSQSAKNSSERTAVVVDDKLASIML